MCNNSFHSQSLLWGAVSVVVSPVISAKMNSQILSFVLVNIMKSLGSRCIPFQVYTRFVAYLVVIRTLPACYWGCITRSFIKGWASAKFDQLLGWFLPNWLDQRNVFLIKKFSSKSFAHLLKPVALMLKTLTKSLCSITESLVYISVGMNERMTAWNWWINKWMIEEVVRGWVIG